MSRRMRGSAILCATIRNSHSGIKRHLRIPPRPEAIGESEEVDLVDGTQHLSHRALDNLVL